MHRVGNVSPRVQVPEGRSPRLGHPQVYRLPLRPIRYEANHLKVTTTVRYRGTGGIRETKIEAVIVNVRLTSLRLATPIPFPQITSL